jgi:hypothetical protein
VSRDSNRAFAAAVLVLDSCVPGDLLRLQCLLLRLEGSGSRILIVVDELVLDVLRGRSGRGGRHLRADRRGTNRDVSTRRDAHPAYARSSASHTHLPALRAYLRCRAGESIDANGDCGPPRETRPTSNGAENSEHISLRISSITLHHHVYNALSYPIDASMQPCALDRGDPSWRGCAHSVAASERRHHSTRKWHSYSPAMIPDSLSVRERRGGTTAIDERADGDDERRAARHARRRPRTRARL